MFSLLLPGRPCLTNPKPIPSGPTGNEPPTSFTYTIPGAPAFSHLVVFLIPGVTLPPGTAASVYIQFPNPTPTPTPTAATATTTTTATTVPPEFKFLGAIANEKPSAFFTVKFPLRPRTEGEDADVMLDECEGAPPPPGGTGNNNNNNNGPSSQNQDMVSALPPDAPITLGISIEDIGIVSQKVFQLQQERQQQQAQQAAANNPASHTPPDATKLLAERIIGNAFNHISSFSKPLPGEGDVIPLKTFVDWWEKFQRKMNADAGFLDRLADV